MSDFSSDIEEIGFSSGLLGSMVVNGGKKQAACCPSARSRSGGKALTWCDLSRNKAIGRRVKLGERTT
jgi:hypothetical protein